MQCSDGRETKQVFFGGRDAVVVVRRVVNAFRHAEACARRHAPEARAAPGDRGWPVKSPEDGDGLDRFLEKSNAEHEAEQARAEWRIGMLGGEVKRADEAREEAEDLNRNEQQH